jgi:hypothetical protein
MSVQGHHDVALICSNGHVINSHVRKYPQFSTERCEHCGAAAIEACGECGAQIRGSYVSVGVVSQYKRPSFCHECGAPYPWTTSKVAAAKELLGEIDGLSDDQRERLNQSIDQLVEGGPLVEVAATRVKTRLAGAGHGIAQGLRDILIDLLSEAAKKALFGEP